MAEDQEEEVVEEEGSPAWMTTFADLSTLLLTFFVLLLSFANMDVVKFREMMGSMKDAFGYQRENFGNWNPSELAETPTNSPVETSRGLTADVRTLIEVQTVIEEKRLEESMQAEATPRGVIVRVKDSVMFAAGSDRLKEASFPFLNQIIGVLKKFPCEIMIEGHTDDVAISTKKFPSNWELSSARAIAVMRYLTEIGGFDPARLGSAGFADTRPLEANDTSEHRATNRRVEFICVRDDEERRQHAELANQEAERARQARLRRRAREGLPPEKPAALPVPPPVQPTEEPGTEVKEKEPGKGAPLPRGGNKGKTKGKGKKRGRRPR